MAKTKLVTTVPLSLLYRYRKEQKENIEAVDTVLNQFIKDTGWSSDKCIIPSTLFESALLTACKVLYNTNITQEISNIVHRVTQSSYFLYCFNKSRYILNMEYNTWNMLMNTGKNEKDKSVNTQILECLPYKAFYIHLDNHPYIDGMFVVRDTVYMQETDGYKGQILIHLMKKDCVDTVTLNIGMSGDSVPINETYNHIINIFTPQELPHAFKNMEYVIEYVCGSSTISTESNTVDISNPNDPYVKRIIEKYTDITSGVCQLLYYICTLTADAVKITNPILDNPNVINTNPCNKSKNKGKTKNKPRKPKVNCTYYDIGYRLGPMIKQYNDSTGNKNTSSNGTGSKKLPHIRRGHFHTYKVGKGRTQTIVKWLAPTYINGAGFMTELPVTLRGVPTKEKEEI